MKRKYLSILFVIATLCSLVTFNLNAAEKHPSMLGFVKPLL